jgi:hypothetical protein
MSRATDNFDRALVDLRMEMYDTAKRQERDRIVAFLRHYASTKTSSMRLVIEEIAKRIENGEGT